jgi:hypothetical protein
MQRVGRPGVGALDAGEGVTHVLHPATDPRQCVQDGVGLLAMLGEERLAGLGNGVELAVGIRGGLGLADLLHVDQRRIDHAAAGRVEAVGSRLERADQLVAVGGLFGEQRQQDQLQIVGG